MCGCTNYRVATLVFISKSKICTTNMILANIAHNVLHWICIIGAVTLSTWIGAAINRVRQERYAAAAQAARVTDSSPISNDR